MQNNYQELWCLCNWTNPGHLGDSSEFESYYMKPMQQGQKAQATPAELEMVRCTTARQSRGTAAIHLYLVGLHISALASEQASVKLLLCSLQAAAWLPKV